MHTQHALTLRLGESHHVNLLRPHTTVAADLLKVTHQSLKKIAVAKRGTIPDHNQFSACPSQCHIHAPFIAEEPNLTGPVASYRGNDNRLFFPPLKSVNGINLQPAFVEFRLSKQLANQSDLSRVGGDHSNVGLGNASFNQLGDFFDRQTRFVRIEFTFTFWLEFLISASARRVEKRNRRSG